jgi:hypothetical protein
MAAHRSFTLVFMDAVWKVVWLACTAGAFSVTGMWVISRLRAVEWPAQGLSGTSGLVLATLLRDIWNAYAPQFFSLLVAAGGFSLLLWIVLEAYVRARLLATSTFRIFLLSGLATRLILTGAVLTCATIIFGHFASAPIGAWPVLWNEARPAFFAAALALTGLFLLLKIFETAVRSDAVELLGQHLFGFAGLVGTLIMFEGLINVSAGVVIASAALLTGSPAQAVLAAALGTILIAGLSLLNSYLLLVRFSAIGIMRHDGAGI